MGTSAFQSPLGKNDEDTDTRILRTTVVAVRDDKKGIDNISLEITVTTTAIQPINTTRSTTVSVRTIEKYIYDINNRIVIPRMKDQHNKMIKKRPRKNK